jgi:hypothetical protein
MPLWMQVSFCLSKLAGNYCRGQPAAFIAARATTLAIQDCSICRRALFCTSVHREAIS